MRNRRKWISGLIVAAALLGFVFWMWQRPAPPRKSIAVVVPPPAARAPPPPKWPASIPIPAGEVPKKVDHSGEIEVCGVGKVKLDRDDWTATGKYFDALTKKSRMRWLSALRNSDDYRARATGLYLEGILDRDAAQKDAEAARDELVQLAVGTKDPAVYALAYTKCIKGVEDTALPGACPQLSLDAWTRADSDNAVPWLQLAAKARREGDGAAEAAAFAHAAQAHQYEPYNWSLFSFAQAAMPADVTAADRWHLTITVIGVEAAMPMPYLTQFQYCSRDAMTDATVRRQCNALAELMVNKTTTLLEFGVGKSLGARVGWPAELIDRLTQQLQASMQAFNQMTPSDPEQQWNCDSVARGNAFMSEWDRLGERGLAQQAIERSGDTVAELARKYTEQAAKWSRDAEASAETAQPAATQP
jgi:hypothetical protein